MKKKEEKKAPNDELGLEYLIRNLFNINTTNTPWKSIKQTTNEKKP